MSHTPDPTAPTKKTVLDLLALYAKGEKLVAVTAYDATMASLMDEAGPDILMVGDSLGMVIQGRSTTLSVTLEEMSYHSRSVQRARPRAHVVCDMPFLSYQTSPEDALRAAGRLVKEGHAESVKLEGGRVVTDSVKKIVDAGVPVMGHVGLTPQSVHRLGGFKVQGRTRAAVADLVEDARALQQAGAYAIVVEGVPSEVAQEITASIQIPTIGIGAGPHTSGQVLVCYDLLGLFKGFRPKFVKHYAQLGDEIVSALSTYCEEVRGGQFPGEEHSFRMPRAESGSGRES